jgi:hypothetical protein
MNRLFGGNIAATIRVTRIGELGTLLAVNNNRSTLRRKLLLIANVVPSSTTLITLMMEAMLSSETAVLVRATRRNIPEDCVLQNNRPDNLISYIALRVWAL